MQAVCSLSVERTEISGNRSGNRGGGLWATLFDGVQATVKDSVITGNEAGLALVSGRAQPQNTGGGIWAYIASGQSAAKLTLAGSEISANKAGSHGGGVALISSAREAPAISQLSVYNTTISGNQAGGADNPSTGGGVFLAFFNDLENEAFDAHFQNVTITDNKADVGGGIWSGRLAAISTRMNAWPTNSIVSDNRHYDVAPGMPGPANNLYGSFNIADTVFNVIGGENTTFRHDEMHQEQGLRVIWQAETFSTTIRSFVRCSITADSREPMPRGTSRA